MIENRQELHRRRLGTRWIVKLLTFGVVAFVVFGVLVMVLWNWLMPPIFGYRMISYWQAVGLLVLSRIFFGGFSYRAGHRGSGPWPQLMFERWAKMTPEERQNFRERMWRDFGPCEPPTSESKS